MRPLAHPAIEDVTVEAILHALADPVRVAIYAGLATSSCPLTCSNFIEVSEMPIPKSTLSQHFKILREGGLIRSERKGVEMLNTPRCEELDARFPGLVKAILSAHKAQRARKNVAKPSAKSSTVRRHEDPPTGVRERHTQEHRRT